MKDKIKLFLFGLVVLFPMAFMAFLSVTEQWVFPHILPDHFSIRPWINLGSGSGDLLDSFALSLMISIVISFFFEKNEINLRYKICVYCIEKSRKSRK